MNHHVIEVGKLSENSHTFQKGIVANTINRILSIGRLAVILVVICVYFIYGMMGCGVVLLSGTVSPTIYISVVVVPFLFVLSFVINIFINVNSYFGGFDFNLLRYIFPVFGM
jgi:hypothetical protein